MQVPKLVDCNSQFAHVCQVHDAERQVEIAATSRSLAVPSHSCTEGKAAPPTHSASRLAHGIAPSRWPVRRYGVDAERRFVHLVLARKQISNGTSHSAPQLDAGPLDWSL